MSTIMITQKDYLTVKALFHATSVEESRVSLSYVYFDNSLKLFVACDGHIVRVEKPETSFVKNHFFARKDFKMAAKELSPMVEVIVDRDPEEKYPDYSRCIPKVATSKNLKPLKAITLDLSILLILAKTIISPKRVFLSFGFTNELKGVLIYGKNGEDGNMLSKFYGLIMPVRLLMPVSGSCSLNTQNWTLPHIDNVINITMEKESGIEDETV